MPPSRLVKTTSAIGSAPMVAGILARLSGSRSAAPAKRAAMEPAFAATTTGSTFVVQYYASGKSGLMPLRPMQVPDAESARMCVDAMPAPVASAVAFRIDNPGDAAERRTIIASRERRIAG